MNNKGFAITTILYGTLILFCMLLLSMLGILSTYKGNLEKLIDSTNGARDIISLEPITVTNTNQIIKRGLYCINEAIQYDENNNIITNNNGCRYISSSQIRNGL